MSTVKNLRTLHNVHVTRHADGTVSLRMSERNLESILGDSISLNCDIADRLQRKGDSLTADYCTNVMIDVRVISNAVKGTTP